MGEPILGGALWKTSRHAHRKERHTGNPLALTPDSSMANKGRVMGGILRTYLPTLAPRSLLLRRGPRVVGVTNGHFKLESMGGPIKSPC